MDIVFLKQARKELEKAPIGVIQDALSLLEDLSQGKSLSMPISRPMPSIARGLHELRLSDRSGEFRLFYIVRVADAIYVLHLAHKKTQKTSQQVVALLKSRMKDIDT